MTLLIKRLLSYFPSKLPVGLPQFDKWSTEVIELSGQFADVTSMRFVLASELMHSDAKKGSVPKNYFVSRCRKLAANQTAGYILQEIKSEQEKLKAKATAAVLKEQAAVLEKLAAEDTAAPTVSSNEETGQEVKS